MSKNKTLLLRLNLSNRGKIKQPFHCTPPFNLKYIESLLKQDTNIEVKLVDAYAKQLSHTDVASIIESWKPTHLVILVNIVTHQEFTQFLEIFNKQCFVIAIGQILSPASLSDAIDIFLPGESDWETYSIIKRLNTKQTTPEQEIKQYQKYKNESNPPFLSENLDDLPFPKYSESELRDYHFLYPIKTHKRLKWGHILSSRGCPYQCLFCSPVTRESYGSNLRLRSARNIIDEMVQLIQQGVNIISFDDDNFTTSKEQVMEVCEEILKRKIQIQWIIHARIDNIDEPTLIALKKAGCNHIRFGIESGSEKIIQNLQKTQDNGDWKEKTKTVFQLTKNLGIATTGLFVIGNPDETILDIEETIQLAKDILPDVIQIHFFTPYPGSKAFNELQETFKQNPAEIFHYNVPRTQISSLSIEELESIRSRFYRTIFFHPKFLFMHATKYFLFYLNNSPIFLRLLKGLTI